jgi:hypothetical protein
MLSRKSISPNVEAQSAGVPRQRLFDGSRRSGTVASVV